MPGGSNVYPVSGRYLNSYPFSNIHLRAAHEGEQAEFPFFVSIAPGQALGTTLAMQPTKHLPYSPEPVSRLSKTTSQR